MPEAVNIVYLPAAVISKIERIKMGNPVSMA